MGAKSRFERSGYHGGRTDRCQDDHTELNVTTSQMPLPVSWFLQSRRILLGEFCVGPSESLHALHVPVEE